MNDNKKMGIKKSSLKTSNGNDKKNIKQQSLAGSKGKKESVINEWLYMTPNEVTAIMIAEHLKQFGIGELDLWEEMNIIEAQVSSGRTIDFEPLDTNMKDPKDRAFIVERDIKTIFAITLTDGLLAEERKIFAYLIEQLGGLLCGDSEDFRPIYTKDFI